MLRIVAISDTHNYHGNLNVPECDLLIHTGDMSGLGYLHQIKNFFEWFVKQPAKHKVLICGNHDFLFQKGPEAIVELLEEFPDINYLQDSSIEIEGYKIYGSPWQPWFHSWAFNAPKNDDGSFLREKWSKIPDDVDILLTHGPPYKIMDEVSWPPRERVGCKELLKRVMILKPILHIFGHIHEQGGRQKLWYHDEGGQTLFINASNSNHKHRVENQPIYLEIPDGK